MTKINWILLLLGINIMALVNYSHCFGGDLHKLLYMLISTNPIPFTIKTKIQIIALITLLGAFLQYHYVTQFLLTCSLGLAVSTGHSLGPQYSANINVLLGIATTSSIIIHQLYQIDEIDQAIISLIFTLSNLFMVQPIDEGNFKVIYIINPYLDGTWQYGVGFMIGVYFMPLIPIKKSLRYLIISFGILVQLSIDNQIMKWIICMIRGLLVYDQNQHPMEKWFVWSYLLVKIIASGYLLNFIFVGYLILSVLLWQKQTNSIINQNSQIQMHLIQSNQLNPLTNKPL